jgi:aryl-alcohol dehydrogenase-like predicted oxidoreductase
VEQRRIGSLEVSVVGLGCNNLGWVMDRQQAAAVVGAALDAGITYFDTADAYGAGASEQDLGAALGARRHEAVVATKFGAPNTVPEGLRGGSPAWIRQACEASLRRLGVDVIDHYQVHYWDPHTPVSETLGALHELVTAGKVRELGCSNVTATQLTEATDAASNTGVTPYRSVQNRYSVLHRDPQTNGVLAACAEQGVAFVPYFPLELGMLTGKYTAGASAPEGSRLATWDESLVNRFRDEAKIAAAARLGDWAAARGHTLVELAFSWLAARPEVASIIAGATKVHQVQANAAAASWTLSPTDLAEIDALVAG